MTEYLAAKTLEYSRDSPKLVIASASGSTNSNKDIGSFSTNNHEEADTLMIYLAVSATRRNDSNIQLTFFSPDTDVLVLAIANYDLLPKNTAVSMTSGILQIEPLWNILGSEKAKALPALHAFSGADTTGRFSRVGKATWFKIFLEADDDIINALKMLLDDPYVNEEQQKCLAKFVCAAYCPKGIQIRNLSELRWHMFCKYMAESNKLPPTEGALKQHIDRVHVLSRVWGQASIAQQVFLDPLKNGYFMDDKGQLKPTTTDVLPAPKAILEMVNCNCKGDCLTKKCACRSESLPCTDICHGSVHVQCENDEDTRTENQDSVDSDAESGE